MCNIFCMRIHSIDDDEEYHYIIVIIHIKLAFRHVFLKACLFIYSLGLGGSNSSYCIIPYKTHLMFIDLKKIIYVGHISFESIKMTSNVAITDLFLDLILPNIRNALTGACQLIFLTRFFFVAHLAIFNGLHIFRHISWLWLLVDTIHWDLRFPHFFHSSRFLYYDYIFSSLPLRFVIIH